MEQYLREWRQYFRDPSLPAAHPFRAFIMDVAEVRISFFLANLVNFICAINTLCAYSMREALVFIRILVGTVAGCGTMVTMHRKDKVFDLARRVNAVAAELDPLTEHIPVLRESTRIALRRARRQVHFFTVYGSCVIMGTMYTMFSETQHWADVTSGWLFPGAFDNDTDGSLHSATVGVAHRITSLMMMCGSFCIITSLLGFALPFVLVYPETMGYLQHQINYLCQVSPCTVKLAKLHSDLLKATKVFNRLTEDLVPVYLLGAFVLPLLSTVDVVLNGQDADQYALVIAPVVFIVFVPICESGDRLAAAHEALASYAYSGPWLEERKDQARLRLNLMLASEMRGALFRGRGIGVLDRGACRSAISGWFKFLQALLNLRNKGQV